MWVDSHCHLDSGTFIKEGVDDVVERARLNRVDHMLSISVSMGTFPALLKLVKGYDDVHCTTGIHPCHVHDDGEDAVTLQQIVDATQHSKVVGIGESGLDYFHCQDTIDLQKRLFRMHIQAALETDLPLVIHAREADDDIIKILTEEATGKGLCGVLHCFSSTRALMDVGLDLGLHVSFSGIVTFNSAKELQEMCKDVPLDRLLVETDAPYLAPTPYRGKRNEPAYVSHTGRKVAEIHGVDEDEMAKITKNNFFKLFNKINNNV